MEIALDGMGARVGRGGRCLVIIAGREGVLCLVVTVDGGEGSGGWTGGACLVIVVLVPC